MSMNPVDVLRHHVSGAIERGEAEPVTEIPLPRYQREFPDFGELDVALPEGAEDRSWHNEACPCFWVPPCWFVFVDYRDEAKREFPDRPRFIVIREVNDGQMGEDAALATDDWAEVLRFVVPCETCGGTGEVARSTSYPLAYRGPGPVPDDARGVYEAKCPDCNGGS